MTLSPSLCIGIPTFNRPNLLHRALASIAAQTRMPDQVLIGDNSANDLSRDVYLQWSTSIHCMSYLKREVNYGPMANFMQLAFDASTTYFMWLADDDQLEPSAVAVILSFLERHPDLQYLGWASSTHNYVTGQTQRPACLPAVALGNSIFANVAQYLDMPISTYFYGSYHRDTLLRSKLSRWCREKVLFDWMDVACVMSNLLNYRSHFLDEQLSIFGVDEVVRPRKGADARIVQTYDPIPWLKHGIMLILFASKISLVERLKLLAKFVYVWRSTTTFAIHHS